LLPIDHYKKLIELSLIALGEKPPAGFVYRKPGDIHKARWMAVAIYGIKMYLFQEQLGYSANYRDLYDSALCYMCQAGCHARTVAADAPVNNIALIKALTSYIQHEDRNVALSVFVFCPDTPGISHLRFCLCV
jgi:hypothetical protein